MSDRIRDWMENWINTHVHFDGYPDEEAPDSGAVALAEQCVIQANEDDIAKQELEDDFGNLAMYMHQAMKRKADVNDARRAARDN